jgi:hypothetical protein
MTPLVPLSASGPGPLPSSRIPPWLPGLAPSGRGRQREPSLRPASRCQEDQTATPTARSPRRTGESRTSAPNEGVSRGPRECVVVPQVTLQFRRHQMDPATRSKPLALARRRQRGFSRWRILPVTRSGSRSFPLRPPITDDPEGPVARLNDSTRCQRRRYMSHCRWTKISYSWDPSSPDTRGDLPRLPARSTRDVIGRYRAICLRAPPHQEGPWWDRVTHGHLRGTFLASRHSGNFAPFGTIGPASRTTTAE